MKPFVPFESRLARLLIRDIDTDQIIPARFLKITSREGFAGQLFNDWRYDAQGNPKPDFVLNTEAGKSARILLAGDNFACGSSREHAVWALSQFGFKAVISTSFADIFRQNSLKNGLLPIAVSAEDHAKLVALPETASVFVDLNAQTITLGSGEAISFPIDAFSKTCILEGIDELGWILKHNAEIEAWEAQNQPSADATGEP